MCLAPITIRNPYYLAGTEYKHKMLRSNNKDNEGNYKVTSSPMGEEYLNLMRYHNTHSVYMQVPCGQCSQCLANRQSYINQRIQMESFRSHMFVFMLSYNNESIKYTDIGDYHVAYPEYSDVQNMFKRLKKRYKGLRYWVVSEYGLKNKRPHYHGILALEKRYYPEHPLTLEKKFFNSILAEWKRNISSSTKYPKWQSLLTYKRKGIKRNYDFHYIYNLKDHSNDLSFYLSKYLFKYDKRTTKLLQKIKLDSTLSADETSLLIKQIKPRSCMSKDFGSPDILKPGGIPEVVDYISMCLSRNKKDACFYDIVTGKSVPLSPYYKKYCLYPSWVKEHYDLTNDFSYGLPTYIPDEGKTLLDYAHESNKARNNDKLLQKNKRLMNKKY